ncbi:MAG: MerR family transcriptional regulator [bacterium]
MAQRGRNPQRSKEGARTPREEEEARRALEASEKLYYRIGEVSKLTGVKPHVLRYWETEFRWMAPPKSRSKQRLYRKRDIELVWLLKRLLWEERYTIAGARQRIQELGVDGALASWTGEPGVGSRESTVSPAATASTESEEAWDESLAAALGELHAELTSLRGLLQEGV